VEKIVRRHHHQRHEDDRRGRGGFVWGGEFGVGPWRGAWGSGRGRHGRGGRRPNVRAAVLALLLERPMHGYEMIQELEARTEGVWRPSPGSVYPTLQLLEDEGLIISESSGGRKAFTLTDAGRAEAERAEGPPPWDAFGDEEVAQARDFKESIVGIMHALRQVGFTGTEEQRAQALGVLNDTRRRLYAILAEES
jgi:DNA-binding PadR family transcriptional regulator